MTQAQSYSAALLLPPPKNVRGEIQFPPFKEEHAQAWATRIRELRAGPFRDKDVGDFFAGVGVASPATPTCTRPTPSGWASAEVTWRGT
jgi:hypothetical protein